MINPKKSERIITNHLQQDVVKVSGKTIYINPFLYWRRFDNNTNRWLREPGQMSEDLIQSNRSRFYPEIEWAELTHEQKLIKDATVEMFLKTLELISTFHPYLSSGELLEVERKMAITKKVPFEKWVSKAFAKKARLLENEKRKFQRERFFNSWKEWFSLENTQKAILPLIVTLIISSFIGWFLGVSKNSCNPYFEENIDQFN